MSQESDAIKSIISQLRPGTTHDICGFRGSSKAMFSARLTSEVKGNILFILPQDEQLEPFAQDMRLFTDEEVLIYPSFEIPPYTPLSPDPATISSRISTLTRLVNNPEDRLVITSVEALLRRIVPASILDGRSELVITGEEFEHEVLIRSLVSAGYEQCSLVKQVGDMAVRGSVIDIYSPSPAGLQEGPLRLDFFGDTLESIRIFDPLTQRSVKELDETVILPCSDILFPKEGELAAWKEYLFETVAQQDWSVEAGRYISGQLTEQLRFAGIEFFLPL
ncbi:MAG: transcription-repair coupling factor, partial [Desulfobulbaceae bacterium]|nr:transcription-repair coupling factor [Desulfobulbaceae bacterium]